MIKNAAITYSDYQKAIFDWVTNGRGHAFVDAVAGSGKTFSLVHAAGLISGHGAFFAFNKAIVTELADRLAGTEMSARTFHSHGFGSVRRRFPRTKLNEKKYLDIVAAIVGAAVEDGRIGTTTISESGMEALRDRDANPVMDLLRIANMARANLTDVTSRKDLRDLCRHFDLDLADQLDTYLVPIISAVLDAGKLQAPTKIDFTDMVWLPVSLNLTITQYPWLFVDEAQDLNRCQLEIALRSVRKGGRILFVGDPSQAIYMFAGADCDSVNRIVDRTKAKRLPLSVCYRCPTSHIELAKKIVPHIEAAPNAKTGTLRRIKKADLIAAVREGDLLLCRTTAPLISTCFALISDGVAATVRGRDIGKGLVAFAKKASKRIVGSFADGFLAAIDHHRIAETKKIVKRDGVDSPRLESLSDKCECVEVIFSTSEAKSIGDFASAVDDIFADGKPSIMLSTIHRAKGLENDRIFLLRPELLPHPMAKTEEAKQQESHLEYVALTRAKTELIFVD